MASDHRSWLHEIISFDMLSIEENWSRLILTHGNEPAEANPTATKRHTKVQTMVVRESIFLRQISLELHYNVRN
jgi:hypothetical protein